MIQQDPAEELTADGTEIAPYNVIGRNRQTPDPRRRQLCRITNQLDQKNAVDGSLAER